MTNTTKGKSKKPPAATPASQPATSNDAVSVDEDNTPAVIPNPPIQQKPDEMLMRMDQILEILREMKSSIDNSKELREELRKMSERQAVTESKMDDLEKTVKSLLEERGDKKWRMIKVSGDKNTQVECGVVGDLVKFKSACKKHFPRERVREIVDVDKGKEGKNICCD